MSPSGYLQYQSPVIRLFLIIFVDIFRCDYHIVDKHIWGNRISIHICQCARDQVFAIFFREVCTVTIYDIIPYQLLAQVIKTL